MFEVSGGHALVSKVVISCCAFSRRSIGFVSSKSKVSLYPDKFVPTNLRPLIFFFEKLNNWSKSRLG